MKTISVRQWEQAERLWGLLPHGRSLRPGQLWRSNDARRFRIVRILRVDLARDSALVMNIVTKVQSDISLRAFTIGTRGWSLEKP